ncbi:MAG: acetyl-CoA carboxylase biotin carboxylase subunit [Bdellovibrionaceae bacterium]|nr:acetyl-CoA carboxylase biotin carboxylase subunit [Pseudobdellovibrionaceae bacterium]
MFKKVLIANRGEIAVRVIRACRDMGIPTVAVYSDVDRYSQHVLLANEAYEIGPAPSVDSYLRDDKIIAVAKKAGVDAIHPGYGFLSERAFFAKAVEAAGIAFIGPSAQNIEAMGDKLSAIKLMRKADVPTVPGSNGAVETYEDAQKVAEKIGYPIMIKASAGGGGKGMRVVHKPEDLESAFRAAKSEGLNYFKDDTVYMERFITNPKHIEIQIFGDKHGNAVHLFERECSVQRRHQKIIEESPSPSVPEAVKKKMGEVAVHAAKSIGYVGAGTFEFIFDNSTKEFFFMEMNTRLQVEHPITEMVTGFDLVKEQLSVAAGNPLSFKQEDVKQQGHAIECRICAEDPETFIPSPGLVRRFRPPSGPHVRVETYVYSGYDIPIYYDPMIAKVVTWGQTRDEAIARMKRALVEFTLTGVKSNIVLHNSILKSSKFLDGSYTTQFCEKDLKVEQPDLFKHIDDKVFLIAAAIASYKNRETKIDNSQIKIESTSRWKQVSRRHAMRY